MREVALTIYFERIEALRVGHLAQLRISWRDEYPRVDELTPLPPWSGGERTSVEFVSPNSQWPFPTVWFGGEANDRSVRISEDRFTLVWRFGPKDDTATKRYPGYNVLKPELTKLFADFAEAVRSELDLTPVPTRVELHYDNLLNSLTGSELVTHVVAGGSSEASPLAGADYCGLRVHYCAAPATTSCSIMMGVDWDDGPETPASLFLEVARDLKDGIDLWGAVDTAHDVLTEKFFSTIPIATQQEWGPLDA